MSKQRIIKFRAWNKYAKKMICPTYISCEGTPYDYSEEPGEGLDDCSDEYTLMQFTGLHDKHGKEIFEGDVLATSNDDPEFDKWVKSDWGNTLVAWDQDYCMFLGIPWTWSHIKDSDSVYSLRFIEVIGNIYENPELMKEVSDGR